MELTDATGLHYFLCDVEDLLVDSEALLHSIHAPAIEAAAPPSEATSSGSSASSLAHDDAGNALRSDDSSSSAAASASSNTHNRKKRSRNSTRDREKEELQFLRRQAAELEQELVAVRNGERRLTVNRLAPAWRRLADRQRQGRHKVEMENKYLKATVVENASVLKRLWRDITERSRKSAVTTAHGAALRYEHERFIEWRDAIVFERLRTQLASDYARADEVFGASGIGKILKEGVDHSTTRTLGFDDTHTRLGELVDARLLPFNLHVLSKAAWQSLMTVCKHSTLYGIPQSDDSFLRAKYRGTGQQDDMCFVMKFQQQLHVDGNDVIVHAKGVMRQYKEDTRTLYVWRVEYCGDGQSTLANTDSSDTGWIVLQKAPSSCASSIVGTVVHSRVSTVSECREDLAHRSDVLAKYLLSSNEQCIDDLSMLVENKLLEAPDVIGTGVR
ncbi:hypothetical protein FI667_g1781, partial [Globisporangium splendens]